MVACMEMKLGTHVYQLTSPSMWISPHSPTPGHIRVHPLAWVEPIGDVGQRIGTHPAVDMSGVFPSCRWSRLIRLHPCPVLITPPEEGWTDNKNKKATAILRQRLDLAAMATTQSVIPNARSLLQPRQRMLLAPAPRAFASLINLG